MQGPRKEELTEAEFLRRLEELREQHTQDRVEDAKPRNGSTADNMKGEKQHDPKQWND